MTDSREGKEQCSLELTSWIVTAYLSRNIVSAGDLPHLIRETFASLHGTSQPDRADPTVEELRPAVPVRKSVTADFIVCLEDGKQFKSLKRHLMAKYGLTPEKYREKWKLPADYPMTAPSYAQQRSKLARAAGLGKKSTPAPAQKPAPPVRKKIGLKLG
ncbi:putative transcriptional regulator [Sinorhizobium fredii]|uniref:Putative mucR family transcriptional regulatory protein y4pD n=1 Tax=Sinorhizobium fredii (strain USDA 257) TaxID=1185652 RepID=I3X6D5_SINF2|nr:MucR family transcriptional regulator [Sinorhizobium fredii]AFL51441.1 putative mucR family transcriptional regulatory protein y4pD [Sinorhizobium fredii USDA 257]